MEEVEARITADMDPVKAASQMDLDEVVRLDEIRDYLQVLIEAAYQGYGYRRVKNPRIWSLHDIAILGEDER
jgi:3-methylcrotonyl-CoA carboxylase beta subunit